MKKESSKPSTESTVEESTEVLKDYGAAVGRIIKIDLSSNGLDAFASMSASERFLVAPNE